MLDGERPGGVDECQQGALEVGLDAATLGRAQALLWDLEVRQVQHRRTSPLQPGLQACGERTEGRGTARLGPHHPEGGIQQMAPLGRAVGQPIGAQQRLGLLAREPVAIHRTGHGLLLLSAEPTQRVG